MKLPNGPSARRVARARSPPTPFSDPTFSTKQKKSGLHIFQIREIAEDKKAAAAAAKADRDAQLAAEEATARASTVSKPAKSSKATPSKKPEPSRGLDLSQLDSPKTSGTATPSLNATGIDNALDALSLTTTEAASDKVDKHPERRFKAAYAAFEARRLKEIEAENPGLRRQQRIEACRKEFEKSPENPFNQVSARYDASKEEVREIKAGERERKEKVLTGA